jgi:5'-nucleotidase
MPPVKLKNARILITNDDGYSAHGIRLLKDIVKNYSNDVWIVAPEFEKSGASHALSFKGKIRLKMQEDKIFSIDGTPSDCVAIALEKVLKDKRPDLILSGINSGCNVGEDVTYSGTIAGAMEGLIRRIPSIAISQNYESGKKDKILWDASQTYLSQILENITDTGWEDNVFMNINFPHCAAKEVKDTHITTQGNRETDDLMVYEVEKDTFRFGLRRRIEESIISVTPVVINQPVKGFITDVHAIANGHISITPLHLDLTHSESLNALKLGLKL